MENLVQNKNNTVENTSEDLVNSKATTAIPDSSRTKKLLYKYRWLLLLLLLLLITIVGAIIFFAQRNNSNNSNQNSTSTTPTPTITATLDATISPTSTPTATQTPVATSTTVSTQGSASKTVSGTATCGSTAGAYSYTVQIPSTWTGSDGAYSDSKDESVALGICFEDVNPSTLAQYAYQESGIAASAVPNTMKVTKKTINGTDAYVRQYDYSVVGYQMNLTRYEILFVQNGKVWSIGGATADNASQTERNKISSQLEPMAVSFRNN